MNLGKMAGMAVAAILLAASVCSAVIIEVKDAGGNVVGKIDVDKTGDGKGVTGLFSSTLFNSDNPLKATAAALNEDHFNWRQTVLTDNDPPVGVTGHPLCPPYPDPPLGGYGDSPDTIADDSQAADQLPWYWDEGATAPTPLTPGYAPGYGLAANTFKDYLKFVDYPSGRPGTRLKFRTELVSLLADGTLDSVHGAFDWAWTNENNAGITAPVKVRRLLEPGGVETGTGQVTSLTPEPATLSLLAVGGIVALRRRRTRQA